MRNIIDSCTAETSHFFSREIRTQKNSAHYSFWPFFLFTQHLLLSNLLLPTLPFSAHSTNMVSFFKKLIAAVGRGYKGRSTVSHLIVGVGWKCGSNGALINFEIFSSSCGESYCATNPVTLHSLLASQNPGMVVKTIPGILNSPHSLTGCEISSTRVLVELNNDMVSFHSRFCHPPLRSHEGFAMPFCVLFAVLVHHYCWSDQFFPTLNVGTHISVL